jgi:hypothetical protein
MQKRSCHDILFLGLFIGFWIGMFYVASQGVKYGNPQRLIYGVDYYGNVCGTNNIERGLIPANKSFDFTHSKYLYFMLDVYNIDPQQRGYIDICVPACPKATYLQPNSIEEVICPYNVTPEVPVVGANNTNCIGTLNSKSLMHRCIPTVIINTTQGFASDIISLLNLQLAADYSLKVFGALIRAWHYIAVSGAGALVLSFVWLLLLSRLAGVLVYTTILGVHIAIAVLCYLVYNEMKSLEDDYSNTPIYLRLVSQEDTIKMLKGVFIALVIVLAIIFFGVLCMWQRIGIAVGIIKEASKAMINIPTILLVPIGVGFSIIPLAVYWFWIGAYLGTTGKPQYDSNGGFQGYETDGVWVRMQLYHFFGGLWTLAFLQAVGECVIAGAIASWYWVHDKSEMPRFPVASSLWRVIRYHLGSLMFGSLILAIVQFIRFCLAMLEKQMKGKEERIMKWLLKIIQCILACFEKFIKFLNKNAYIMISIYGYSFCTGAKRGFTLIAGNLLRVTALHCVSGFVIFLGKLFVCMITTVGAFAALRHQFDAVGDYVIPTIAIAILSYAIAVAFFSVFDMAIDTLLLCFCEDCERNNGADRPYYMSDALKAHVDTDHKGCCC